VSASQHNLVVILARDFASRLATAVFLVDPHGSLVYFNEAAEGVLGQRFTEGVSMPADEWATAFEPVGADGSPIPLGDLPLGIALDRREPAHLGFRIVGGDGVAREIEVTAFPLFAHADEFVGAMAIFWQLPGESGNDG
jgi:PAS domain-containing protein